MAQSMSTPYDILLLDDDEDIRHYLALFLETEGFRCLAAEDGKSGFHQYISLPVNERPRIAFVDLMMPHLDGLGFVNALNEAGEGKDLEVTFVSASLGRPQVNLHGRRCGFLSKPFHTDEVLDLAHRRLGSPIRTRSSSLPSFPGSSDLH